MILLASLFNSSSTAKYLISYKRPRKVINEYKFKVELVGKLPTSMHASAEGHTCYFFCHIPSSNAAGGEQPHISSGANEVLCDPLFQPAWDVCRSGDLDRIHDHVDLQIDIFLQTVQQWIRNEPDRLGSWEK